MMRKIDPETTSPLDMYQFMIGAVSPRPIAFVSTIDTEGVPNLAPFSFFNAFSSKPPILGFATSIRAANGTTKDTLANVQEVNECVVNIVSHSFVRQMSLTAVNYPKGVSEFEKAGLTPIESDLIRPFRVKESPVQMECKVREIIQTGVRGGAANLVICEIILMHIDDSILDSQKKIDPLLIDQVARMGGNWYSRAAKGLFEVPKPLATLGIGVDQLPDTIKYSTILTGNDLGMLGNIEQLPSADDLRAFAEQKDVHLLLDALKGDKANRSIAIHIAARQLLAENKVQEALKLLFIDTLQP